MELNEESSINKIIKNLKIGNYVETIDGEVGYITKVFQHHNGFDWISNEGNKHTFVIELSKKIGGIFSRIGNTDFSINMDKKSKIDQIVISPKFEDKLCTVTTSHPDKMTLTKERKLVPVYVGINKLTDFELYNKINEIIEYINKQN